MEGGGWGRGMGGGHLQLGRHVPQADLAVVAAGDDGAEVVHHQEAADAVCGSCAAP